jgi:hypothetical protein
VPSMAHASGYVADHVNYSSEAERFLMHWPSADVNFGLIPREALCPGL